MALEEFILLGDALWLDFVNTARGRSVSPPDRLPDANAWIRWASLQQLDAGGEQGFPPALQFRVRLTELADALHEGRATASGVIAALNHHLGTTTGRQQLTRVGGDWRLRFAPAHPAAALEAIARSAAATLAHTRLAVRRCAADACSLFFTDDSPTGSRRWCDAEACGRHSRIERRRGAVR